MLTSWRPGFLTIGFRLLLAAGAAAFACGPHPAIAQDEEAVDLEEEEFHLDRLDWSFAGPFGQYDQAQLQRGFKVYRETCSLCHGMEYVAFRTLGSVHGPNFSEAAVEQIASEYQIVDGPNDAGEMFERPGLPSDYFPAPFPNEEAAAAAYGGAAPPDLSLIAKARAAHVGFPGFVFDIFRQYQEAGPDYVYALLTGYREPPEGADPVPGRFYNPAFLAGSWIAMPPPLSDGQVEYTDGTPETLEQYSRDVAAFLMWAAEPKLEQRKQMGFKVMIFLIVFAGLLYLTKRKIWRTVHH